jgi:hypothetical protein
LVSEITIIDGLCCTAVESFLTEPSASFRSVTSRIVQIIPVKILFWYCGISQPFCQVFLCAGVVTLTTYQTGFFYFFACL